ncbi:hypothetical protein [Metallosphaera hakonensis]|uniref:Uncharacterized protein n=1 Tax=Metallosphaera hakonensis JCM 8857 = DSM 7519 TaxID=1293036 RepID=A0A2U9IQR9_9CREN|nr:hypothetical protein [Metallosphaera hakonensis]AWR98398.1 hypothetical protein DFR87_00260 [Metallosphaera hakonensis JCM 8857 = DSM 7519]
MRILTTENRKYICVKIDEVCGEGVDGYCVKKEDQGLTDPFLIEIKVSSSKIGRAKDQIISMRQEPGVNVEVVTKDDEKLGEMRDIIDLLI